MLLDSWLIAVLYQQRFIPFSSPGSGTWQISLFSPSFSTAAGWTRPVMLVERDTGRNTVEKVSKGAFFVTLSDRFPPKKNAVFRSLVTVCLHVRNQFPTYSRWPLALRHCKHLSCWMEDIQCTSQTWVCNYSRNWTNWLINLTNHVKSCVYPIIKGLRFCPVFTGTQILD